MTSSGEPGLGGHPERLILISDRRDEQALVEVAGHDGRAGVAPLGGAPPGCRSPESPFDLLRPAREWHFTHWVARTGPDLGLEESFLLGGDPAGQRPRPVPRRGPRAWPWPWPLPWLWHTGPCRAGAMPMPPSGAEQRHLAVFDGKTRVPSRSSIEPLEQPAKVGTGAFLVAGVGLGPRGVLVRRSRNSSEVELAVEVGVAEREGLVRGRAWGVAGLGRRPSRPRASRRSRRGPGGFGSRVSASGGVSSLRPSQKGNGSGPFARKSGSLHASRPGACPLLRRSRIRQGGQLQGRTVDSRARCKRPAPGCRTSGPGVPRGGGARGRG